ncbi:hypothetical protein G5C60_00120 [Streptomyces sp. HC44]|uniref:Uncharacterized protein n=1 Tax=Streptomyces scabichelini TaxID=2711217 RepID=A0A6G4UWJ2_9ACTN|nr:hypothetical protein [Streptomyces scabichelini]NGO06121.1 hypothetical protein [Streptomyces scabichelini]
MNNRQRTSRSLLTAAVIAAGAGIIAQPAQAAPSAAAACTYKPTLLPVSQGVVSGHVFATAGTSTYAGRVDSGGSSVPSHAALWKNGVFTDLGTVPGAEDDVTINDVSTSGVVVGTGYHSTGSTGGWPTGEYYPFRSRDGRLEQLPVPAGAKNVVADAISPNGDIYGSGQDAANNRKLFLWPAAQPGTVVTPTNFPAGSSVIDVDADGTLAINAGSRSYLWKDGSLKTLPLPTGATNSQIASISNGRAVGSAAASGEPFGVLWDKNGLAAKLPNSYQAGAINSSGLIVGDSARPRGAALWQLTTAQGAAPGPNVYTVNDAGTLAGSYYKAGTLSMPAIWPCG